MVKGLRGVSLSCIAALMHSYTYFKGVRTCPTHFLARRDLQKLEEPLHCGTE